MKKLTEIAAEGEYQLPFEPTGRIKRHPAPAHKKLGLVHCIDWSMPINTSILAARDGTVEETESRFNTHGGEDCINKTNYVVIGHDNNESSVYAHLRWRGVKVKRGQQVKAGQIIGYSGQTGFAEYPHLHFGVYKEFNGREVNVKVKLKRR